jgi:uncharacterized protein YbcI
MARTHFNDNLITVVVQNLLTKGERSLVRDGKETSCWRCAAPTSSPCATTSPPGIEEITGRQVIALFDELPALRRTPSRRAAAAPAP